MKTSYTAASKDLAWTALEALEAKWGKKYPHAIRSWKENWADLSHFFDFPIEIRTMIYTTNISKVNLTGKKLEFDCKSIYLTSSESDAKFKSLYAVA